MIDIVVDYLQEYFAELLFTSTWSLWMSGVQENQDGGMSMRDLRYTAPKHIWRVIKLYPLLLLASSAFGQSYTLSVTATGSGIVTSSSGGISCSGICSASYASGTHVTLTQAASTGWTFAGWGGACSGTGSCTVAMSANESVTALFTYQTQLPQIWVDNNELTCKLPGNTCYSGSPGIGLSAPSLEIALGSTAVGNGAGGSGSIPSGCSALGSGTTATNFPTTAAGLNSAIQAVEGCRTMTGTGIILDIPPISTDDNPLCGYAGPGSPQAYCETGAIAGGIVIPQTNSVVATAPIILRSSMESNIASLPVGTGTAGLYSPVCAGGIQDNVSNSTNIGLHNPDCTGQNMYYELGPQNCNSTGANCADDGIITGITTLSTNTVALQQVTAAGAQTIALKNGYVSPYAVGGGYASYLINYGQPDQESVSASGTNCGISIPNQVGICANFGMTHAVGFTVQLCAGPYWPSGCSYALAGGISGSTTHSTINTTNYNYLLYMPQIECTGTDCEPIILCTSASETAGNTNCVNSPYNGPVGVNCNAAGMPPCNYIGPDHWEFEDLAISICPGPTTGSPGCSGASSNSFLFDMGGDGTATVSSGGTYPEFAHDIHIRRAWGHGDWTSLYAGTNSLAGVFYINNCYYCSLGDSQVSQAIRPGGEGHSVGPDGNVIKLYDLFLEGQSSGVFCGGLSLLVPAIATFVPCVNLEQRVCR
jgi:hypothetical protein